MVNRSYWLMALAGILVGILVVTDSAQTAENDSNNVSIVVALSNPGDICSRGDSRSELAMCIVPDRPAPRQLLTQVTCAANQWCCKHDFAKKVCVQCCAK